MSTAATSGVGAALKRGDGASSEVFTTIAEVNSVTNNKTRDLIDVTALDSAGGYREKIPGFKDGGEYTFNMNFTLANYNQMNDEFESDTVRNWQLLMPNTEATVFDFAGYVTALGKTIPLDDKINCDVVISVTGQETLTS